MTDLVKKVMCVGAAGMLALGLVACSDSEKKPSSGGTHVAATALPSTAKSALNKGLGGSKGSTSATATPGAAPTVTAPGNGDADSREGVKEDLGNQQSASIGEGVMTVKSIKDEQVTFKLTGCDQQEVTIKVGETQLVCGKNLTVNGVLDTSVSYTVETPTSTNK
jgi:lipoprotein